MLPSPGTDLSIFICYRRADTSGEAVALSDKLNRRRGFAVFKDVDNIRPGQDWVEAIEDSIELCDVLLVLIGTDWVGAEEGHSLDEYDHVRREIEAALSRKKAVIPILFEMASMPHSEQLPDSLHPLLRRQSVRIRNATFNRDLDVLVLQLRTIARQKAPPKSTSVAAPRQAQTRPATLAPAARPSPRMPPPPPPATSRRDVPPTAPRPVSVPARPPQAVPTSAAQAASSATTTQPGTPATPRVSAAATPDTQPVGPGPGVGGSAVQYGSAGPATTGQTYGGQGYGGQPYGAQGAPQYGQPTSGWGSQTQWQPQAKPGAGVPPWVAQAAGGGLVIGGGLLALIALIAVAAPQDVASDVGPSLVVVLGAIFGAAGVVELVAAYGVFKRLRWSRPLGAVIAGIVAVVMLLSFDAVTIVIAIFQGLVVAGLLLAKDYFPQAPTPQTPPGYWR